MFMTLLTCLLFAPITMAPYARWVYDAFRHILVESCDEFLQTSDHGGDKARLQFITNIASQITVIAEGLNTVLPEDLEKVS